MILAAIAATKCVSCKRSILGRGRDIVNNRGLFDIFFLRLSDGKCLLNGKCIVKNWVVKHVIADASNDLVEAHLDQVKTWANYRGEASVAPDGKTWSYTAPSS